MARMKQVAEEKSTTKAAAATALGLSLVGAHPHRRCPPPISRNLTTTGPSTASFLTKRRWATSVSPHSICSIKSTAPPASNRRLGAAVAVVAVAAAVAAAVVAVGVGVGAVAAGVAAAAAHAGDGAAGAKFRDLTAAQSPRGPSLRKPPGCSASSSTESPRRTDVAFWPQADDPDSRRDVGILGWTGQGGRRPSTAAHDPEPKTATSTSN